MTFAGDERLKGQLKALERGSNMEWETLLFFEQRKTRKRVGGGGGRGESRKGRRLSGLQRCSGVWLLMFSPKPLKKSGIGAAIEWLSTSTCYCGLFRKAYECGGVEGGGVCGGSLLLDYKKL